MTASYVTIFRREAKGVTAIGDLLDVRVGDTVSYRDDNHANVNARVAKVNVRAKVLRTEPFSYNGHVLRVAKTLPFDRILSVSRLATAESTAPILDTVGSPVPDQTPKAAVRRK